MLRVDRHSLLLQLRGRAHCCIVLAVLAVSLGCAHGGGRGGTEDRRVISREEIESVEVQSAYGVIEELRPLWLRDRGATSIMEPGPRYPDVAVDGMILRRGIEELRQINAVDIGFIRYVEPGEASMRFGMKRVRGVIEVVMALY